MAEQVGLLFFPAFDWSLGKCHPEREERLLYTRDQLFEEGLLDLSVFKEYGPRLANCKDVARAHAILPDFHRHLTSPHFIAAGGAITLGQALMSGEIKRGFAMIRPPGHHAMHTVYGNRGFCTINNVAILVNFLRRHYGIKRLAVVDTDVHHGDGTQDIFYHDPDVLYISIHQDGRTLYPGTGFPTERGGPQAWGSTLNIPLPPGTGDEGLLYVLQELVLPAIEKFQPELIINSAGQDNHFTDPLANMQITAQGYGQLTKLLRPDIAVLEGGYAIETALPYVNLAISLALADMDFSQVEETPAAQNLVPLRVIKTLVNSIKQESATRPKLAEWYERDKSVFYDTEYLWEKRHEKVRRCGKCAGLQLTFSGAAKLPNPKLKNLVVKLPFHVCPSCRAEAERIWHKAHQEALYQRIYWQDQAEDNYRYFTGTIQEINDEQPD